MRWTDDYMNRERFLRADDSVFDVFPAWQAAMLNGYADEGAAFLNISACDSEALLGVDPDRLTRASRSETAIQPYVNAVMSNGCPWCVASDPHPELGEEASSPTSPSRKRWTSICGTRSSPLCRISGKGRRRRALARAHGAACRSRVDKLNALHFESLCTMKTPSARDLNIRLPKEHVWSRRQQSAPRGRTPSSPTCRPRKSSPPRSERASTAWCTPPCRLSTNGNIIENFHFVIKDGRIVDVHAEKGEDILQAAIAEDEGA